VRYGAIGGTRVAAVASGGGDSYGVWRVVRGCRRDRAKLDADPSGVVGELGPPAEISSDGELELRGHDERSPDHRLELCLPTGLPLALPASHKHNMLVSAYCVTAYNISALCSNQFLCIILRYVC
jgi:hypothetical protein